MIRYYEIFCGADRAKCVLHRRTESVTIETLDSVLVFPLVLTGEV
jgi:hypothetical protein